MKKILYVTLWEFVQENYQIKAYAFSMSRNVNLNHMNRIVVLNGVLTGKQLDKEAALHTAVTGNYFIIEDADDRFIDFLLNLSPIIP